MQDIEKHANLLEAIVASLKSKLGSQSPPIPVAEELHALGNVAIKLRDPAAEIVEHAQFVPSYGGANSTLGTVERNMPPEPRAVVGVAGAHAEADAAQGNSAEVEVAESAGAGKPEPAGVGLLGALGVVKDKLLGAEAPEEPALKGTQSGHDLNINAGATEPPKEV